MGGGYSWVDGGWMVSGVCVCVWVVRVRGGEFGRCGACVLALSVVWCGVVCVRVLGDRCWGRCVAACPPAAMSVWKRQTDRRQSRLSGACACMHHLPPLPYLPAAVPTSGYLHTTWRLAGLALGHLRRCHDGEGCPSATTHTPPHPDLSRHTTDRPNTQPPHTESHRTSLSALRLL